MVHIPFLIFSFSYLKPSLLPQNYSCTYQRVYLYLTVSVMFFDHVTIIIAALLEKTTAIETTVLSDCMIMT